MRRTVSVLLLAAVAALSVSAAATPEALFDLGLRAFRAGDYASAVVDLGSAARQLDPASPTHHTALVYLALAQFRMGMEDAARDTILRLAEAERGAPAYATLNLGADAADFEALHEALAPNASLPRNTGTVLVDDPTVALPSVRPATPPATPPAIEATTEVRVEEIQEETERRIAAIEADAERRIAEIQAEAERRIAAAQTAANERVAAAQAAADQRVAAALDQAQRDADARIAAINRQSEDRIAAAQPSSPSPSGSPQPGAISREEPRRAESPALQRETNTTAAQPSSPSPSGSPQPGAFPREEPRRAESPALQRETNTAALTTLRQADSLATSGDVAGARDLYVRVANNSGAPREVLGEAGTGLYRIGAYRESAGAFRRLGTFARGEEDLRYYFAVALYESGEYREAQKELACALPFIQRTEDVERYRLKIEQTMAVNLTTR